MSLTLDDNKSTFQIQSYSKGQIKINQVIYHKSLIIGPHTLITDWKPQHIEELTFDDLNIIRELHPSIFLLGTGDNLIFPPITLYGDLVNQGIGIEIMKSRAACLTFNALTAENREVMAAILLQA